MQPSQKPVTLKFRVVGISEHVPESGFSPNRDVLVVRLMDPSANTTAKVVFRYMGYEHKGRSTSLTIIWCTRLGQ